MQDPNQQSAQTRPEATPANWNALVVRLEGENARWKLMTMAMAFVLVFLISMGVVWTVLQRQEIQTAKEHAASFEKLAKDAQELATRRKQRLTKVETALEQALDRRGGFDRPGLTLEQKKILQARVRREYEDFRDETRQELNMAYRNFVDAVEQSKGAGARKLLHSAPVLDADAKLDKALREAIDKLVKSERK